jgi:hypothetical protein
MHNKVHYVCVCKPLRYTIVLTETRRKYSQNWARIPEQREWVRGDVSKPLVVVTWWRCEDGGGGGGGAAASVAAAAAAAAQ